jgi:hypothetical protein
VNDPPNLIAWIRRPRAFDPRAVMPDLAVTAADAQDIAAFLGASPSRRRAVALHHAWARW